MSSRRKRLRLCIEKTDTRTLARTTTAPSLAALLPESCARSLGTSEGRHFIALPWLLRTPGFIPPPPSPKKASRVPSDDHLRPQASVAPRGRGHLKLAPPHQRPKASHRNSRAPFSSFSWQRHDARPVGELEPQCTLCFGDDRMLEAVVDFECLLEELLRLTQGRRKQQDQSTR